MPYPFATAAYVSPADEEIARRQLTFFLDHYGLDKSVKEAIIWDFDLCTFEWASRRLHLLPPRDIYQALCKILFEEIRRHPLYARL